MRSIRLLVLFIVSFLFTQPLLADTRFWDKLCKKAVAHQPNLYEVYNECIDFCMATNIDLKKMPMKDRVKLCTFFTARIHNERVVRNNTSVEKIDDAIDFCQDQKLHKTGGHWLYISRQCKRIVCEYNPMMTSDAHDECKNINEGINNGKTEWIITPHKYEQGEPNMEPRPPSQNDFPSNQPPQAEGQAPKPGTPAVQNPAEARPVKDK